MTKYEASGTMNSPAHPGRIVKGAIENLGLSVTDAARALNPSIIVMDMFMPNMDGLTATRALRDEPALRRIPVIAQTAQPSVVSGARELFDAVLAKPCSPEILIRTICDVLGR